MEATPAARRELILDMFISLGGFTGGGAKLGDPGPARPATAGLRAAGPRLPHPHAVAFRPPRGYPAAGGPRLRSKRSVCLIRGVCRRKPAQPAGPYGTGHSACVPFLPLLGKKGTHEGQTQASHTL